MGDKNGVMVAARILAYGPEYQAKVNDPKTGDLVDVTFDLTECPFKEIQDDYVQACNHVKVNGRRLKAFEMQAITWVVWRRINNIL